MHWQDHIDEKKQQLWQSRIARERLELSASVEEALIDGPVLDNLEADELDDEVPASEKDMLIPPRLSLQSKQMPAVSTLSKVRTDQLPIVTKERSTEFSWAAQNKQRSPRRTTKVRLQVVPRAGAIEEPAIAGLPPYESAMVPALPAVDGLKERIAPPSSETSAVMSGCASFERGQSEVMVASTHITSASVVVVVLTADPGPVVVQYISLQPRVGFTVHLSAAAKNTTSFNYKIC